MKTEQLYKRMLCVSRGLLDVEERKKKHVRTEANKGNHSRDGVKKCLIITFVAISCICSYAATDVLFLADTTGSMEGLSNYQTAFSDILEAIDANSPCPDTIMYALADYRNYTDGGNYTAYGVNLDQSFTDSIQNVLSAINALTADGGVDPPESQLKAMTSIVDNWLTTSGDLGFSGRAEAQKIIVWGGDVYGHIAGDEPGSSGPPPDGYYPTLDETIEALTAQGIIVFALNPSDCDKGLNQAYAGVYNQALPARQQASEITNATGGTLFCNIGSGSPDINDAIVDTIDCYSFIKDDDLDDANDLDCRFPGQELTYSICLTNDSDQTIEDAYIIDWLPEGVDFVSAEPNGIDDPNSHSYWWSIGDIAPDATVCVYLTVVVNSAAEPGLYLHNEAELIVGEEVVAEATKDTLVCCWGDPNMIYVDTSATGNNTGVSWQHAYTDLSDALGRATDSNCVGAYTIYVAQGIYDPNNTPDNTFALTDGLSVYGGFKGGSVNPDDRDPKKYETILTGLIDDDAFPDVDIVVTMANNTLLDGFTVTETTFSGSCVYGNGIDIDFTVENCIVANSGGYGIYAKNGNATVKWCKVLLNERHGIYHTGAGYTLTVDNSWLLRNGEIGIWCENSTPTVKNSTVSESSFIKAANAGIRIENPTGQPKLHNLTISNNKAEGIFFAHSDPNYFLEENSANRLEIQNCIVYFNNGTGPQFSQRLNMNLDRVAHYSCIADCNEVNFNTNARPMFAYRVDPNGAPDPNNYHLHFDDTACKEAGDPYGVYTGQVDIDGEGTNRIEGDYIDIGADEVRACVTGTNADIYNDLDWNADGLVNLHEYSKFSQAWLGHDPNDPVFDSNSIYYNPNVFVSGHADYIDPNRLIGWYEWKYICNRDVSGDSQYSVDLADLMELCEENPFNWLWKACWKDSGLYETMGMSGGGESMMMTPMMETMSFEATAVELVEEVDPYAEMSASEVVSLVTGIHEIIDHIEIVIEEDRKNAKDLIDAIDFLEGVLADIEAARQ